MLLSVDEIDFKSSDYEILKSDPIVKWGFLKLDYEGKVIKYSIEKKIDVNEAKEAKSIVLIGPTQLEKASNVVGYSILSFFKSDSTPKEKLGIWVGIIIIGLLTGYYFIIVKGNAVWIKEKIRNLPKVPKINIKTSEDAKDVVKEYPHLSKIKKDEETSIYSNISPLSKESGPGRYKKKDEFAVINELIMKSQEYLSTEDFDKAADVYPRIELLYKNLPKEHKSVIYPQCVELQKSIKEGNREFYTGVL